MSCLVLPKSSVVAFWVLGRAKGKCPEMQHKRRLSSQTSYLICIFPPITQAPGVVERLACTVFLYSDDTVRTLLIDDCHVPSRRSHLHLHSQCGEVALALNRQQLWE